MTPLLLTLGSKGELMGWTIQNSRLIKTWVNGEGAYKCGGRWNSPGRRVIYATIDPATALAELAVHACLARAPEVSGIFTIEVTRDRPQFS